MNLILIGCFLGSVLSFVSCESYPCNEYVDKLLRDLKEDKELFQDPYKISEKSIEVHKKFIFVNYTGEAKLYDGYVFGLSTLHRDGDVIIDKKKKAHFKINLGAGELKLRCSAKLKLMGYGPQLEINAVIKYVNMKLDVVPTSNGTNPKIVNFKLEDVKGLEVKVSRMGPLNFFLNSFIKIIGTVFKNLVRTSVESRLSTFLDKKLKKYVIPTKCINDSFFY